MSAPEALATDSALDALPSLPRDSGEPVFAEPWQAQAFALAVRLSADGHFTWKEWTAALADELAAAVRRGEPDDGSRYYHHWVAALERLVTERGLAAALALDTRKEAWTEAYRNTPHGQPVELKQTDYLRTSRVSVMRTDGREVQIVQRRAHLSYCHGSCCCGDVERGYAPVPVETFKQEWMRRRLKKTVHLTKGGCLGPCTLANVASLVFDGHSVWFHSVNTPDVAALIFDYIDAMIATDGYLPPPPTLARHVFRFYDWEQRTPRPSPQVP
ncbi:MAG: nitrile hydratase accessory protein [Vicinamibacterales bacterium]